MIKTIRICDRCGKEITGGIYYTVTACMIAEHLTKTERSFDYCESCGTKVITGLGKAMETKDAPADPEESPKQAEPAEGKKKGGRPKKKLDLGKVGALYKAGWTIAKIADEMNVGSSTIQRALAQIQEENNG